MGEWKNNIRETHIHNPLKEIRALQASFEAITFSHTYRELNTEADTLSKLALAIQAGIIEGEIFSKNEASNIFIQT